MTRNALQAERARRSNLAVSQEQRRELKRAIDQLKAMSGEQAQLEGFGR